MGVTQPKSATASTGGGHTAERCEHKSLSITKLADLSSPVLMQNCSAGRTIPKARLEFMRADGNGDPVKYYEIELENVLIGSMDQVVHEGSGLHDAIGLKFSRVKWKYTQQKIGGGAGGNTAADGILPPTASREDTAMPGVQPQDSRRYFMLPQAPEDSGYYVYGTPGSGAFQYAHPSMMTVLMFVEREWAAIDNRKFGIGNISLAGGPENDDHASHTDGMQVDVRALRKDGLQLPVTWHQEQ